jgi:hypothetical protein
VKEVGLHAADVPKDLKLCTQSGPLDTYIAWQKTVKPDDAASRANQIAKAKTQGMQEGSIAGYAADDGACAQAMAAPFQTTRSFAEMIVLKFGDDSTAARAFDRGLLTDGSLTQSGAILGITATKPKDLGDHSEAVVIGQFYSAAFQKGGYYAWYVSTGLSAADNQKAVKAVYDRI